MLAVLTIQKTHAYLHFCKERGEGGGGRWKHRFNEFMSSFEHDFQ